MRLGNLRGFDSLYRIRTGIGLLMIHSLFHCYRPRPDSWPVVVNRVAQLHPLAIAHYKIRKALYSSFSEKGEQSNSPILKRWIEIIMDIDLIKRSIRLDRQRLQDTSSDLLIQKKHRQNGSGWKITGDKRKDK